MKIIVFNKKYFNTNKLYENFIFKKKLFSPWIYFLFPTLVLVAPKWKLPHGYSAPPPLSTVNSGQSPSLSRFPYQTLTTLDFRQSLALRLLPSPFLVAPAPPSNAQLLDHSARRRHFLPFPFLISSVLYTPKIGPLSRGQVTSRASSAGIMTRKSRKEEIQGLLMKRGKFGRLFCLAG